MQRFGIPTWRHGVAGRGAKQFNPGAGKTLLLIAPWLTLSAIASNVGEHRPIEQAVAPTVSAVATVDQRSERRMATLKTALDCNADKRELVLHLVAQR